MMQLSYSNIYFSEYIDQEVTSCLKRSSRDPGPPALQLDSFFFSLQAL